MEDLDTLRFFQHGEYPPEVTSNHWDRIQQRSKCYSWKDNHLIWCLPKGDIVVPPPHERLGFIQKVHSELGHFGIKRTYSLFAPHYHWRGMYAKVQDVIARCKHCDRVRTSFSSQQFMVFPLLIRACSIVGQALHTFPMWMVCPLTILESPSPTINSNSITSFEGSTPWKWA